MIKLAKCGIAAAVMVAAGVAAFQSYGSYGTQDNSLLMQNVEALAQSPDGGDGDSGDGSGGGFRYPDRASKPKFCNIYVYTKGGVTVLVSDTPNSQLEASGEYIINKIQGIYDMCPDKGYGCNPMDCQMVPYQ